MSSLTWFGWVMVFVCVFICVFGVIYIVKSFIDIVNRRKRIKEARKKRV